MKNKRHHFVPQFYLRAWSLDGRTIGMYNIKKRKVIFPGKASITGQCKENWLYGRGCVENILSNRENSIAPILKRIREGEKLPLDCTKIIEYMVLQVIRHPDGLKFAKEVLASRGLESDENLEKLLSESYGNEKFIRLNAKRVLDLEVKLLGRVDILFLGDERGNKTEKIELATLPGSQTERISCK